MKTVFLPGRAGRLFASLCLIVCTPLVVAGQQDADRQVERMLANLGGREVWASAKSVFTMERARYPVYGDGIIASHWLDLEAPGERMAMLGESLDLEWAWQPSGGWFRRGEDVRDFESDELAERQNAWERDLFRLLQRLARNDAALAVRAIDKGGLHISEGESALGELWLTRDGDLFRWKRPGKKEVTMIFGSMQDFGNVRFPDWGTSATGEWSAYYTQILLSPKPFLSNTTLRHPHARTPNWQGGALHPDSCEHP